MGEGGKDGRCQRSPASPSVFLIHSRHSEGTAALHKEEKEKRDQDVRRGFPTQSAYLTQGVQLARTVMNGASSRLCAPTPFPVTNVFCRLNEQHSVFACFTVGSYIPGNLVFDIE